MKVSPYVFCGTALPSIASRNTCMTWRDVYHTKHMYHECCHRTHAGLCCREDGWLAARSQDTDQVRSMIK